ncbi:MAG TPA: hypothetical protein VI757_11380, partial [Bacteroidia bacterium]|nr:hypothetical protein [Bacteroidia bacterium]
SCCTYNHYFSFFFAGIVCATGFLFVSKKNILTYCIACISIALLYLPHLSIFLTQISYNKGVGGPGGWLGKPESSYLFTYIFYMFHYSKIFLLLCAAIAVSGMVWKKNLLNSNLWRYRIICLLWFLIPFVAGYFYSVKVNPVLQYSGLIFSFPFLLMFLFSFVSDIKPALKISFIVLVLATGITTLVYGRNHYELFYNQGIHKITAEINSAKQQLGKDSVDAVINVEDYFFDYYRKNFPFDAHVKYESLREAALSGFRKAVSKSQKNYFVFATVSVYPLECVQILKEYYPFTVSEYEGHLTEIICCSKNPVKTNAGDEIIFSSENNFTSKISGWNYDEKKIFTDSISGKRYLRCETLDEYGVEFQQPLVELIKSQSNIINVIVNATITDTATSPLLVMTLENGGKSLDWRATKFSDYLKPNEAGNVFLSVRFSDIHISTKNVTLKAYVWNKDHATFSVNNVSVSSEKGNPYFYGLFEEF